MEDGMNDKYTMVPSAPWRNDPRYAIVHHSGGNDIPIETVDRIHREERGWLGVAYQYWIRRDGTVEIGRHEGQVGSHAGPDFNARSIGICLTGNFQNDYPTDNQLDALLELLRDLTNRYPITPERILGHRDVRATKCPGNVLYEQLPDFRHVLTIDKPDSVSRDSYKIEALSVIERIEGDLAKLRATLTGDTDG